MTKRVSSLDDAWLKKPPKPSIQDVFEAKHFHSYFLPEVTTIVNSRFGRLQSQIVFLLDFREAYDSSWPSCLSDFSGFSEMIRKTTTVQRLNSWSTGSFRVVCTIRQECPLAPVLFLVAADILALSIQQNTRGHRSRSAREGVGRNMREVRLS